MEQNKERVDNWEKSLRFVTFPIIWFSFLLTGALSAYVGISQDKCTEGIPEFDLLYRNALTVIPACVVILLYLLNLYGFFMVLHDWYRISSLFLHLLLYTYFGVLVSMLCNITNEHLEIDYDESECLPKFDQKNQVNAIWTSVILCILAMSLIQFTPFNNY